MRSWSKTFIEQRIYFLGEVPHLCSSSCSGGNLSWPPPGRPPWQSAGSCCCARCPQAADAGFSSAVVVARRTAHSRGCRWWCSADTSGIQDKINTASEERRTCRILVTATDVLLTPINATCFQVSLIRLLLQSLHLFLLPVHDVQLLLRTHWPAARGSEGSWSELWRPWKWLWSARVGMSDVSRMPGANSNSTVCSMCAWIYCGT